MAAGAPKKKSPRKRTTPAAAQAAAGPVPAQPVDEWLLDVARPRTITVFGRDWAVKAPTGQLAVRWDTANAGRGIGAALALMMADETPIEAGREAGSARAMEFLALAEMAVPIDQAAEFWLRIEAALFPGEARAS